MKKTTQRKKTIINKIFDKEQCKKYQKKIDKIYNDYFFDGLAPNLADFELLIIKRELLTND